MMNSIAFHYNLFVNFKSFDRCIKTVKMHHPKFPIHLVTDQSLFSWRGYKSYASQMNIAFTLRQRSCVFIDRNENIESQIVKTYEWFERMYLTCKIFHTEWVVRLEDDVYLRRPILSFPETTCAGNHGHIGGMGAGSIMKRNAFIELWENMQADYIEKECRANPVFAWAADGFLKKMFLDHGYSYSKWIEISEDWQDECLDGAIHHGDKSLYDECYLESRTQNNNN